MAFCCINLIREFIGAVCRFVIIAFFTMSQNSKILTKIFFLLKIIFKQKNVCTKFLYFEAVRHSKEFFFQGMPFQGMPQQGKIFPRNATTRNATPRKIFSKECRFQGTPQQGMPLQGKFFPRNAVSKDRHNKECRFQGIFIFIINH